ncbi:MAG: ankyrin repeat domain-containing protein [Candidatus Mucispirillum faecigallinarum]|nr:ankyrin repeat domain-containing protein [Candidatus Mucispirillum faecigallinarum]
MNKVAVTFVIVVIVLAVIIQLDYSSEHIVPDNNPAAAAQNDIYDKYYIDYNLLDNIQYIKDNSLSLKDNRLISAVITQDINGIKKLINSISSPNIIYNYSTDNYSAAIPLIFLAIGTENKEIIDIILNMPNIDKTVIAQIPMNDYDGKTVLPNVNPLCYAVYTNNLYAAEKLIASGVDVNQKMPTLRTAVFFVRTKESLDLLIKNGADINAKSLPGNTPLIQAVSRNNIIVAYELIANKVNPNQFNKANTTPLTTAISRKNINMVKMLISNGADVNFFNSESQTPLMIAVSNADLQIFNLLISMGADVNHANSLGKTCIYYMQAFQEQWTIWRAMLQTLKGKIDINHQDNNGDTVLHINPERYWLYKDLNPDVNIQNNNGDTPLHILVRNSENADIVKSYIEGGANINIKNKKNETALDIALKLNHQNIVKELKAV